jgi:hypothetical protein
MVRVKVALAPTGESASVAVAAGSDAGDVVVEGVELITVADVGTRAAVSVAMAAGNARVGTVGGSAIVGVERMTTRLGRGTDPLATADESPGDQVSKQKPATTLTRPSTIAAGASHLGTPIRDEDSWLIHSLVASMVEQPQSNYSIGPACQQKTALACAAWFGCVSADLTLRTMWSTFGHLLCG